VYILSSDSILPARFLYRSSLLSEHSLACESFRLSKSCLRSTFSFVMLFAVSGELRLERQLYGRAKLPRVYEKELLSL
jgi:hypothetical protein